MYSKQAGIKMKQSLSNKRMLIPIYLYFYLKSKSEFVNFTLSNFQLETIL